LNTDSKFGCGISPSTRTPSWNCGCRSMPLVRNEGATTGGGGGKNGAQLPTTCVIRRLLSGVSTKIASSYANMAAPKCCLHDDSHLQRLRADADGNRRYRCGREVGDLNGAIVADID